MLRARESALLRRWRARTRRVAVHGARSGSPPRPRRVSAVAMSGKKSKTNKDFAGAIKTLKKAMAADELARPEQNPRPEQNFAARTLNATGQYRVTLSLR